MHFDWNSYNNRVSLAILKADRLDDLLIVGLDCDLKRFPGAHYYRGPCPVHGGRRHNLHLRTDGDTLPINWKCYSRHCEHDYKPSLLGLVRGILSFRQRKKVPLREAKSYIDRFLAKLPAASLVSPPARTAPRPRLTTWTRAQVRQRLVIPSPYFVGRGFAPSVLDQMDVGHSPKLGRSVVPLYDDEGGTCIGHAARWEGPACPECGLCHYEWEVCGRYDERWRLSADFPKSAYLYNLEAARQPDVPFVVMVEGPGEVWRLRELNVAAVACMGSELTWQQAEKLAALNKRVFIAFDNDGAGQEGAKRAFSRLSERGVACSPLALPPGVKDIAEMHAVDVAAWLGKVAEERLAPGGGQTRDLVASLHAA
jgi:hypothetical protein